MHFLPYFDCFILWETLNSEVKPKNDIEARSKVETSL